MRIRTTVEWDAPVEKDLRYTFAIATFLLWLRMLTLLKAVNIKLATFLMAIAEVRVAHTKTKFASFNDGTCRKYANLCHWNLQITKDTLWYLIILVAIILCFGQVSSTIYEYEERLLSLHES